MNVYAALGFMALGGAIVFVFDCRTWKKYYDGKREGEALWKNRK